MISLRGSSLQTTAEVRLWTMRWGCRCYLDDDTVSVGREAGERFGATVPDRSFRGTSLRLHEKTVSEIGVKKIRNPSTVGYEETRIRDCNSIGGEINAARTRHFSKKPD